VEVDNKIDEAKINKAKIDEAKIDDMLGQGIVLISDIVDNSMNGLEDIAENPDLVTDIIEVLNNIVSKTQPAKLDIVDALINLSSDMIKQEKGEEDIVDGVIDLVHKMLPSNNKKNLIGGAGPNEIIDENVKFDDDILKMRYLNTQKYKDIDANDVDNLRINQTHRKKNVISIKTDNKIEQLSNDIDVYNDKIPKNRNDELYIIKQIKNFENDPKNPIEELALTFDDRIVFIIATFFIRYITIIMVQWCIDINIIKTFYEGFIYYAIIYIIIFWFIVLFVNIDNTYDVKYMNFNGLINSIRTLFYYFYMGTNGISRLLIHTSLIIILIVIPIILNIKKRSEFKDEEQNDAIVILAYEERKQLSKSLSLFTMFIWLFTGIIATKF